MALVICIKKLLVVLLIKEPATLYIIVLIVVKNFENKPLNFGIAPKSNLSAKNLKPLLFAQYLKPAPTKSKPYLNVGPNKVTTQSIEKANTVVLILQFPFGSTLLTGSFSQ